MGWPSSFEVGPEVNTDKSKYTSMSHQQNTVKNHNIKSKAAKFNYLEMTVAHQTNIHDKINQIKYG